jgi:outer membrane immunogenic protein
VLPDTGIISRNCLSLSIGGAVPGRFSVTSNLSVRSEICRILEIAEVLHYRLCSPQLSLTVASEQQFFVCQEIEWRDPNDLIRGGVMKKFLVSAVALAALSGAPATAADLSRPVYKAPPPVYFSWTGCYIGGNVGGLWVHREFTDRLVGDRFFGQTFDRDTSTVIGGVQGGCNYQFAGGWVVGIQGDYDWSGNSNDGNSFFFNNLNGNFTTKNLASVTGRIGYAFWDRFLGYVKGGAAWERDDFFINFPNGAVASLSSNTRSGWTVGVGGEYAFTNWLTGFIEYDHYGFGNNSDNFVCGAFACVVGLGPAFPVDRKESKDVVKVGLNFLWGGVGKGPLARY